MWGNSNSIEPTQSRLPLGTQHVQQNVTAAAPANELHGKVASQVTQLQQLWADYERSPTPQLKGTISQGVTKLQSLMSQWPHSVAANKEIQEAQDYLLACSLYLGEMPREALSQTPATHRERVMQTISQQFNIVDAGAAGNCCIHAALFASNPELNSQSMVDIIRGDVVHDMRSALMHEIDHQWDRAKDNQTQFLPFIGGNHGGSQRKARELVNTYCDNMTRRGTWFGEPELPFLARALSRDVVVYDAAKLTFDTHGKLQVNDSMMRYNGGGGGQIEILHDGNHYLALIPKLHKA